MKPVKVIDDNQNYVELSEKEDKNYLDTIRIFKLPPPNFNSLKATAKELTLYGYPRRPDSQKEVRIYQLWVKTFLRPLRHISPKLEIDKILTNRRSVISKIVKDGRFAPSGWGGIVTRISDFGFSPTEPINMVYGEWMIPSMQPDFDNPSTAMTVGFWVGIDGYTNNQVLQAGTAATVTGETIDYWAWFEWYPAKPVRITNFSINPGEVITVLVCSTPSNQGFVSMLNKTTGETFSVGIPPPTGVSASIGDSAEWIVEGVSSDFPNFTLVGFHNCTAGTKSHTLDFSHPIETEIAGTAGDITIAATMPQNNSVLVFWEGIN